MALTPAERTLRARLAAHTLHAKGGTTTEAARSAFLERFYDEVDPDRQLSESERERRAEHARSAYFTRLSLKAAKAKRTKAAAAS